MNFVIEVVSRWFVFRRMSGNMEITGYLARFEISIIGAQDN